MTAMRYRVRLSRDERIWLGRILHQPASTVFIHRRAAILLAADHPPDRPAPTDEAIAAAVDVSPRTVVRVRADWAEGGVAAALASRPRGTKGRTRFDTATRARIAQVACSEPPPGHARWTVRLLTDEVVSQEIVPAISPETVRTILKKTISRRG
jgi:hypothetical protein